MNHYFGTEFFVIYIVLIWTLSSEVNGKNNSVERNGNLKTNQGGEFFRRNFTFGISELRKVFSPIDLKTLVIHFYFCKKKLFSRCRTVGLPAPTFYLLGKEGLQPI